MKPAAQAAPSARVQRGLFPFNKKPSRFNVDPAACLQARKEDLSGNRQGQAQNQGIRISPRTLLLALVSQGVLLVWGLQVQQQYAHPLWFWIAAEVLLGAGLQDALTMYFPAGWLLAEGIVVYAGLQLFPFVWLEHLPGFLLCLLLPFLAARGGLGLADVWMMVGMAIVLNWNQMAFALLCAILIGMIHLLFGRVRMTPFICGLSIGCLAVLLAWEQLLAPFFSIIGS